MPVKTDITDLTNVLVEMKPQVVRRPAQAAALLDPQRIALVRALMDGPDSASGLARRLSLPRQRVNYHLRVLEREGILELVETRRCRNCWERVLRATASAFVLGPELVGACGPREGGAHEAGTLAAAALRAAAAVAESAGSHDPRHGAALAIGVRVRFASTRDRNDFAHDLEAMVRSLAAEYHDPAGSEDLEYQFLVGGHWSGAGR